ncbi:MAG: deoxyribose-phosphate aldolase [Erysipelotrichaceae bacterium]|nr:deoxyribose-phosphate aldolase [Erysipelotrichaceae bacterium]
MKKYSLKEFAKFIDHTYLKAYATETELKKLCDECRENGFAMTAINSFPVKYCHEQLKDTGIHVGAAISFPLGQTTIAVKVYETLQAIADGADEIDYVLNIGKVKEGNYAYIKEEMIRIKEVCDDHRVILKVIFETCYLTKDEIKEVALIAKEVRPDFIKTSTGFGPKGADVEDVKLMKETVGDTVKVKASGGIRDLKTMIAMIEAGAERIGTSNSLSIMAEYREYIK